MTKCTWSVFLVQYTALKIGHNDLVIVSVSGVMFSQLVH